MQSREPPHRLVWAISPTATLQSVPIQHLTRPRVPANNIRQGHEGRNLRWFSHWLVRSTLTTCEVRSVQTGLRTSSLAVGFTTSACAGELKSEMIAAPARATSI